MLATLPVVAHSPLFLTCSSSPMTHLPPAEPGWEGLTRSLPACPIRVLGWEIGAQQGGPDRFKPQPRPAPVPTLVPEQPGRSRLQPRLLLFPPADGGGGLLQRCCPDADSFPFRPDIPVKNRKPGNSPVTTWQPCRRHPPVTGCTPQSPPARESRKGHRGHQCWAEGLGPAVTYVGPDHGIVQVEAE